MNSQTIKGSSATSFNAGLIANQNMIVETGAAVQVGAGKSMTANSDVDLFGTLSGSDAKTALVLAGAGNRLNLHDASVSVAIVLAKDGQRHNISGKGVFVGCDVRAESGSSIVLDAHLTLVDGNLEPSGDEISTASGSTIVYRGSSARPISPMRYWNLAVESNPGAYLIGPTTVLRSVVAECGHSHYRNLQPGSGAWSSPSGDRLSFGHWKSDDDPLCQDAESKSLLAISVWTFWPPSKRW